MINKEKTECINDITMFQFLHGDLEADEKERVSKHLDECMTCFSSLAYSYKANKDAGEATLERTPDWLRQRLTEKETVPSEPVAEPVERRTFWSSVSDFIQKLNNVLPPLPAYAATGVLLLILAKIIFSGGEIITVSPPIISLDTDQQPIKSFGFMGWQEDEQQALPCLDEVSLNLKGRNLIFSWPEIRSGGDYTFNIKEKNNNRIIKSVKLENGEIIIPVKLLDTKHTYIWEVSGQLESGETFAAMSEFIWIK